MKPAIWFGGSELAGALFNFDNFAILVEAALGAGTMRQFALVAIRTFGKRLGGQMIVRPPLGCTRLGMAPFGIRH
jgi:hypothetical protein